MKKIKKLFDDAQKVAFVTIIIVLAMTLAFLSTAFTNVGFNDVKTDYWAYDVINECADAGLINGYGNGAFGPLDTLTWAQWLALVERVCFPTETAAAEAGDHAVWYEPNLRLAKEKQLVNTGTDLDKIAGEGISRADMVLVVYNAIQNNGLIENFAVFDKANWTVEDLLAEGVSPSTVDQLYVAVNACNNHGIIQGDDTGLFSPSRTLIRAEAAAVVWRVKGILPVSIPKPEETPIPTPTGNVSEDGYDYSMVPMTEEEKALMHATIGSMSRETAEEILAKTIALEINKSRADRGLPMMQWNDTLHTGLHNFYSRIEKAGGDVTAGGYFTRLLDDVHFIDEFYPKGLKVYNLNSFVVGSLSALTKDIPIVSETVIQKFAHQVVDDFVQRGINRPTPEEFELALDSDATLFGIGVCFDSSKTANWWDCYYMGGALAGPSNVPCPKDRTYERLEIAF